jgi:hypothetical protein
MPQCPNRSIGLHQYLLWPLAAIDSARGVRTLTARDCTVVLDLRAARRGKRHRIERPKPRSVLNRDAIVEGERRMASADKISVAINGYRVIGKRVADAVACQDDMTVAGVCDVTTDWRPRVALRRGYALFGASAAQVDCYGEGRLKARRQPL